MAKREIIDEAFAAAILGRAVNPMPLEDARTMVAGRRVLVTGAGGFIGSELVRLICGLDPAHVALLDNGESSLYAIDLEVSESHPDLSRSTIYADIRDRRRIDHCFRAERPDLVFHAAALKHLPLMQSHAREAVLTNTLGVRHVAEAALAAGAMAMVLISTDKAVDSSSVMGASKRMAEVWCQAMDAAGAATRFISVRFGNVFGSTGSVAPLFQRQIEAGGPITLTDPAMTRYFMTLGEAARLVICASRIAIEHPERRGPVFLLEMGEPLPIALIAERMIRRHGLDPQDVGIRFIGPRNGEKVSESLVQEAETLENTTAEGIRVLTSSPWDLALLRRSFDELDRACGQQDDEAVAALLARQSPGLVGWDRSAPRTAHGG